MLLMLAWWGCVAQRALEAELALTRAQLLAAQVALEEREREFDRLSGELDGCSGDPTGSTGTAVDPASLVGEAGTLRRSGDLAGAKARFEQALAADPEGASGKIARRALRELSLVGAPAPVAPVLRWLQGAGPSRGRLEVVLFWEQWCPHCRRAAPELQALVEPWRARGVTLTSYTKLSEGDADQDTLDFLHEHGLVFPVGVEDGTASNAYFVTGIPAVAVVKDGVVVYRGHPSDLSDALLETLLAR